MDVTFYQCYQGLKTQNHNLEVASNNLSNINTVGFKAEQPFFSLVRSAAAEPTSPATGHIVPNSFTSFAQGSFAQSSNPLDLALDGKGFFCVKTPTGLAYTRNGNFKLGPDGYLVTQDGYRVQGIRGDIRLDSGDVQVDRMGNIQVSGASSAVLKIVDFADYNQLEKVGETLFRPSALPAKEVPANSWALHQGAIESSNVNATDVMVNLVALIRRFEMIQKAMNMVSSIDSRVIEQVGRSRS